MNSPGQVRAVVADSRSNCFDLVRLLAATWVLVAHAYPLTGRTDASFFGYDKVSKVAVYIFFAASGYLVTQSWQSDPNLLRFALRRSLRLFPALIVVVVLSIFVLGPLATELPLTEYIQQRQTWGYLKTIGLAIRYRLPGVFGQNPGGPAVNGSLWSLPLEVFMYAFLAGLGLLRLLRTPWTAAIAVAAFAWGVSKSSPSSDRLELCDLGVYFWMGSLFAQMRLRFDWRLALALCSGAALCAVAGQVGLFHALNWIALPYATLTIATFQHPILGRAGRYGDWSYGIYVYAFPVQQLVVQHIGTAIPLLVNTLIVMALTLACASLSWRLVEQPALRFKPARPERG